MENVELEKIEIKTITAKQTLELRQRILWPDKPIEHCMVTGDDVALHFGAFDNQKLVCVASIFTESGAVRLRKFATELNYQGLGIGSKMIETIILQLDRDNINEFWCDARESATSFYTKLGMKRSGGRFYKSDVPYYKMAMQLFDKQ